MAKMFVAAGAHSPRVWGWTAVRRAEMRGIDAFPTRVGVDLWPHRRQLWRRRIPHACGGGPGFSGHPPPASDAFPTRVGVDQAKLLSRIQKTMHSPRVWGWTLVGVGVLVDY